MKLMVYKPTAKGIKKGIRPHHRIMFLNKHYIHIKTCGGLGYYFAEGDVFEYVPRLHKPDSLWEESEIFESQIFLM